MKKFVLGAESLGVDSLRCFLSATGALREQAIEQASCFLLKSYRENWPWTIPTDLYKLAASLSCQIVRLNEIEGGAGLYPKRGGFDLFISNRFGYAKWKTSVAHELVHCLFYDYTDDQPRRLFPKSDAEENFCHDVARRLLAPLWQLDERRIHDLESPIQKYELIRGGFKLSNYVAARLLLQDYKLANGVSGGWEYRDGKWIAMRGNACASQSLDKSDRRELREKIRKSLETQKFDTKNLHVFFYRSQRPTRVYAIWFV